MLSGAEPITKFIGDAFKFGVAISAPGITDFSAWDVSAAALLPSGQIVTMTRTWVDHAAGIFELSADTSNWVPGWISFNICFLTDTNDPFSTNSNSILMAKRLAPVPGVA